MNNLRLLPKAPALTPAAMRAIDPDRYLAGLFVAAEKRDAYFLLCAFNNELARAREVASVGMLALIRLQWWREVVEGTFKRHEIAEPLWHALEDGTLNRPALLTMIEAREIEADAGIPDLDTFAAYVEGTAGGFAAAAGLLLGAAEADLPRLRSLGAVYGTAGQIANIAALARADRCQLPETLMAQHGLTGDHIRHDPTRAAPVAHDLSIWALHRYREARGAMPRRFLPAVLPTVLGLRDLRRGEHRRLLPDIVAVIAAAVMGRV